MEHAIAAIPRWALDKAAKEVLGLTDWEGARAMNFAGSVSVRDSIAAHARTIAKYEKAPLPHQQERSELARLLRFMNMTFAADQVESGGGQSGLVSEYIAIMKERNP